VLSFLDFANSFYEREALAVACTRAFQKEYKNLLEVIYPD